MRGKASQPGWAAKRGLGAKAAELRRLATTNEHGEVASFVVQRTALNSSTYYNLACYYSLAGKLDESLYFLEYALESPSRELLQWVWEDPTLQRLRDGKEPEFQKLLRKVKALPPEATTSLANLILIGPKIASKLEELAEPVKTTAKLVERAGTKDGRTLIEREARISSELLWRAALLAEVIERDSSIGIERANLLHYAGLGSLTALAAWKPRSPSRAETLTAYLRSINLAAEILDRAPGVRMVEGWLRTAEQGTSVEPG